MNVLIKNCYCNIKLMEKRLLSVNLTKILLKFNFIAQRHKV